MLNFALLLMGLLSFLSFVISVPVIYPHVKIWKDLLKNYDRRVNPVLDPRTPVNLSLLLSIESIIELDFKREILTLKAWFGFYWKDEFLVYNESEYNTDMVYADPKDIWLPDVSLMKGLDEYHVLQNSGCKVLIRPNGDIIWVPNVVINILCPVKVEYFPFDTQSCNITLQSWTQSRKKLAMRVVDAAVALVDTSPSSQWSLKNKPCFVGDSSGFDYFKCPLSLTRQPSFYVFNLVVPCLVLVLVGSLTFVLPVDSGEKVSLSVTILLAMTVMVQLIMDSVPAVSGGTPFLGKFIMACIILLALATAMSVTVVKVLEKSQTPSEKVSPKHMKTSNNKARWRRAAVWLDRVFLVLYLSITAGLVLWIVAMAMQYQANL